jgi:tripartite-type tricarboxylate transporter receptor subunit TctC
LQARIPPRDVSTVAFSTPAEFATLIKNENERWSKVIKAANVKLD